MKFKLDKKFVQLAGLLIVSAGLLLPQLVFAGVNVPKLSSLSGIFGSASLAEIIIRIIQVLLAFLGVLAVGYMMYGGFIWMTAGGDESKVQKAKNIILQTVIGLVIIFSSYAISAFLFSYFVPPVTTCDPMVSTCGPCSTGATNTCSTDFGKCGGLQTCTNGSWGGCVKQNAACPINEYAKLTGWKSDSEKLSKGSLMYGNNQVNNLPSVSDLQIRGEAYKKNGSVDAMSLLWGIDLAPVNFSNNSVFTITAAEKVAGVFAPLNSTTLDPASTYRMYLNAQAGGDINSSEIRFKIRPIHCFNKKLDTALGETDIDCGGPCGACDGESCSSTPAPICTVAPAMCSSGICHPTSCLCVAAPVITYISPAQDEYKNNDGHDADKYSDDIGNGAPDNIITLQGRNFGATAGKVYFMVKGGSTPIEAVAADCTIPAACTATAASYWTNNQIVVKVPAGASSNGNTSEANVSSSTANYEVYVVTFDSLLSDTRLFEVNNINRPGICNICPAKGQNPTEITITGNKFQTNGKVVWQFSAYDFTNKVWGFNNVTSTGSGWTATEVKDIVPENRKGVTGIRVFDNTRYSNYYNFMISAGQLGDPCGYDSTVCDQDLNTCDKTKGLACDKTACTCVVGPVTACVPGGTCTVGGCSGKYVCDTAGTQVCIPSDPKCVPFLGASAKTAIFSWQFSAYKKPTAGMSCASNLWGDGTCDLNGCLESRLSCDTSSSSEEWIELYNQTGADINLSGWKLAYGDSSGIAYPAGSASLTSKDLSGTIANLSFLKLDMTNVSGLSLSKQNGVIYLIDGSNNVVSSIGYGDNGLEAGYSPASLGRKIDGVDNSTTSDFKYFSNSSPGTSNDPTKSGSSNNLSINEISLAHDACTCVPRTQLCSAGTTDTSGCAPIGQCKAVRQCDSTGHYSSCQQQNPACIPYITTPSSTIAVYAWKFGASTGAQDIGPKIVSDCDGSTDCNQNDLPSPSPWSEWNPVNNPNLGIKTVEACLNAQVYARFTALMDDQTINTTNIRLYKQISAGWEDQTLSKIESIDKLLSTGETGIDSFALKLKPTATLDPDSTYRIFVSKNVRDEIGRPLINNDSGARQELCDVGGSPTTDPGVCWSFETRGASDPDKICLVGCVNCGPTKYFNRYYGAEKEHKATPLSLDNSCISLDNRNYAWDWSEQEQNPGGAITNGWTLQKVLSAAYSWMTNPLAIDGVGVASQPANTVTTGYGTTTALSESKWRTNADYKSWFGSDDFDYFQIKSEVQATGHAGVCSVHNNFTDPVVIESQYCTKSDDTTKQILQSPSPWKGQTDACINGVLFALFSRNMLNSSLVNSDDTVNNFEIYKCDNEAAATSSDYATYKNGCTPQTGWTAEVFNYNHSNITLQDLLTATESYIPSLEPEGVRIIPKNNDKLDTGSWYKIVIGGGYDGVRGGVGSVGGNETAEGILQVPSVNARMTAGLYDSYYWYFKTGLEDCPIDQVAVLPQLKFMPNVGDKQNYLADPYAANCNHLNSNNYTWRWDSLINPFIDRCATNSNSGDYVATICETSATSCSNTDNVATDDAKAFSQSEGNTKITAAAVQGTCSEYKWGFGELQVGYGGFRVTSLTNSDCLNAELAINFSQDADSASLMSNGQSNVQLYECSDETCLTVDSTNKIPLTIKYPQGLPSSPDPALSNRAYLTTDNDLINGKTYRVVVNGGPTGVKSFIDSDLIDLNFSVNPNNGGEACDPNLYPFRFGDPLYGKCSATNCTLTGSLCGTKYQECKTDNPFLTPYCDAATCKSKGNSNIASCGNGKIEPGEDCDDSNIVDGDGCSSSCLLEGSNSKYNSNCGNARIEKGEQCDDGNTTVGDGCSDKCLYENNYGTVGKYAGFNCTGGSALATTSVPVAGKTVIVKSACQTPGSNGCDLNCKNTGSKPGVPICGNGKIEFGEECDDGVANGSGNRCSKSCLLSGATPYLAGGTCGNGKLEDGKFDSYSKTFKVNEQADVCTYIGIGLNPCPNGVWNVKASAETQSLTFELYKGSDTSGPGCISDAEMKGLGFWRAAIDRIVKLFKRIFGFQSAIAADFWCKISSENYSEADLAQMRLGDFKREITVDGADATISAYTEDKNNYKINYIRSANWEPKTEYKAIVSYIRNGIPGTTTDQVLTQKDVCAINDIRFDVWPRGNSRKNDGFFCASDPATGKPDECGRYSEDPSDDDMSAAWTKAFPDNGYNMCADGTVSDSACATYKFGNNHLYRLWALSGNYTVRGNFIDQYNTIANISGTKTAKIKTPTVGLVDNTFFVTSGANPGRSLFKAYVSDIIDTTAGDASKDFPIFTYFCSNPWPDATNFPFIDSNTNCTTAGSGTLPVCINTNFGTYYCRDSGIAKTCVHGDSDKLGLACASSADCFKNKNAVTEGACILYTYDDLPSIGNYNALTGKLDTNSGAVYGNYGQCNNLPANFKPTVGYKSVSGDKNTYIWNNSGSVYLINSVSGNYEEVNKSVWAINGLPGSFKPVFAVSEVIGGVPTDLLFSSSEIYSFNASKWQKNITLMNKLPKGFWPQLGAASGMELYLVNSAGQLVIVRYNSDGTIANVSAPATITAGTATAIRPKVMSSVDGGVVIISSDNKLYYRTASSWDLQTVMGMPTTLNPVFSTALSATEFTVWVEPKGYVFKLESGVWSVIETASLNNVVCDNKIKDFLFGGILSSASKPITLNGDSYSNAVGTVTKSDGSAILNTDGTLSYKVNVPSSGKYYVTLETANMDKSLSELLPVGHSDPYGSCVQNVNLRGNIFYFQMDVDIDNDNQSTITALASATSSHQFTQTPVVFDLPVGEHTINVKWTNDCWCDSTNPAAGCIYGPADPNLKLFTVKLVPSVASASDAIGIRIYNNSSHLSPNAWYVSRFFGQNRGNLQSIQVDGYMGGTEGTTAYINAADYSDGNAKPVVLCGNGKIDPANNEDCDRATYNGSSSSGCTSDCKCKAGWICNANNTQTLDCNINNFSVNGTSINDAYSTIFVNYGASLPVVWNVSGGAAATVSFSGSYPSLNTKTTKTGSESISNITSQGTVKLSACNTSRTVTVKVNAQPACNLNLSTIVDGVYNPNEMTLGQTLSYTWDSSDNNGQSKVNFNDSLVFGTIQNGPSGGGSLTPTTVGKYNIIVAHGCSTQIINKEIIVNDPCNFSDYSATDCTLDSCDATGHQIKKCNKTIGNTCTGSDTWDTTESCTVNYTVTFDKNTGDTPANPATMSVASGASVGSLPTSPTKAGKNFSKWNTMANGNGTDFYATTPVTSDITVYAIWVDQMVTVNFSSVGATTQASPIYKSVVVGQILGTLPTEPTKTGKVFTGWNTAPDGSGSAFDATMSVPVDMNVYAMWNDPIFTCGNQIINTGTGKDGLTYGSVLANDGRCWLDRNLGASSVAIAYDDALAYGDYYQWGRGSDGHQIWNSATTNVLGSSDTPGDKFIITNLDPNDWRQPQKDTLWQGVNGINNPCPSGFRVPTENEFNSFLSSEGLSVGSKSGSVNMMGIYNSKLKLTAGGFRHDVSIASKKVYAMYWTQNYYGTSATRFAISNYTLGATPHSDISFGAWDRDAGMSVRCIQDKVSANLEGLALTSVPASQTFNNYSFSPTNFNYSNVTVDNAATSFTVTPTWSKSGTIKVFEIVAGSPVEIQSLNSGIASNPIVLVAGVQKTIMVAVTEPNSTPKNYFIDVTRQPCPVVGQAKLGGTVAYVDASCHGLVISPRQYVGSVESAHWAEAVSKCDNLTLGSYSDWFLPNSTQLLQILSQRVALQAVGIDFSGMGWIWSSTESGDTAFIAGVWSDDTLHYLYFTKTSPNIHDAYCARSF